MEGMRALGITEEETAKIFSVLAIILHLGNIGFSSRHTLGDNAFLTNRSAAGILLLLLFFYKYIILFWCALPLLCPLFQSSTQLTLLAAHVAELLGCDIGDLEKALLTKQIKAGSEQYTLNLSIDKAANARDALVMSLYQRLFEWRVSHSPLFFFFHALFLASCLLICTFSSYLSLNLTLTQAAEEDQCAAETERDGGRLPPVHRHFGHIRLRGFPEELIRAGSSLQPRCAPHIHSIFFAIRSLYDFMEFVFLVIFLFRSALYIWFLLT